MINTLEIQVTEREELREKDPGKTTLWRFGISKYDHYSTFLITFQCHGTRIFETPTFGFDGCQIWKIYIPSFPIISLVLRIINEHDKSSSLPLSEFRPSVMDCNDGRSIQIISFEFIQYSRLLLIRNIGMHYFLM